MDLFEFEPSSCEPSLQPRVKAVRFGDGYEQRQPGGLNHMLRRYSLEFSDRRADIDAIDEFLEAHGGVDAFRWLAPDTYREITVVCRQWAGPLKTNWRTLSCVFEEVPA
ncbi:phage tail protein [Oceanisphaera sediminis]|uniref:Phage tail protein n=1 Tax=Oceanisphaera sediminis TaxID=981381 RepID=A0ABP7DHG6_9GAMM